jgi:DNA-binding NtrC family response regulator
MPTQAAKQNARAKILVVDDKEQMRDVLRKFLAAECYSVEIAADGRDALRKFSENKFELVLSNIKMPAMDGAELLREILKINSQAIVILMTAFGSIEAAVAAIKLGATDYVSKPFQMEDVLFRISRALKEKRVADLESKIQKQSAMQKITGGSGAIKRLKQIIERIAPTGDTVLITGAIDTRIELFELASNGTLFLDEVETLSLAVSNRRAGNRFRRESRQKRCRLRQHSISV